MDYLQVVTSRFKAFDVYPANKKPKSRLPSMKDVLGDFLHLDSLLLENFKDFLFAMTFYEVFLLMENIIIMAIIHIKNLTYFQSLEELKESFQL